MIYYSYEGNFQLECDAQILYCQVIENDDKTAKGEKLPPAKQEDNFQPVQVCLDRTVLHAQGGGQPTDTGILQLEDDQRIVVEKVLLDRLTGVATHTGKLFHNNSNSSFLVGETVRVLVDADNRQILSECHTAGHVVDMAMSQCDMLLPPTKAYHFLDGPYVEYKGSIPPEQRNPLLEKLQACFQDLVEADIDTEIQNLSRDDAAALCNRVAENYFNLNEQFKEEETVRIVRVAGWPCPCGGTHVKSTGILRNRKWGITGLKCKKGVVRVRYGQDWNENGNK
jgi:Ser-tRNA(Ala) deacylase AlaX